MARWPTYLLKAPDDRMARYRAAAVSSGVTFADFIRDALDEHTARTETTTPEATERPVWLNDPRKRPRP